MFRILSFVWIFWCDFKLPFCVKYMSQLWHFLCMNSLVCFQIAILSKNHVTVGTLERLFFSMNPPMCFQGTLLGKSHVAIRTCLWPFFYMNPLVGFWIAILSKGDVTMRTLLRFTGSGSGGLDAVGETISSWGLVGRWGSKGRRSRYRRHWSWNWCWIHQRMMDF